MAAHPNPSHTRSLWAATAIPDRERAPLEGQQRADVAIIGGGFTGLAAALSLAERGTRATLLEANLVGWGASGRTGGQVIPGLKYDPDHFEEVLGPELAHRFIAAIGSVGDELFGLVERHRIDCNAVRKGWVQPAISQRTLRIVAERARQWQKRGANVELLDRARVAELIGSDLYLGGWIDRRAGHIQPLSFCRGLAAAAERAGATIHVRSPALSMTRRDGKWVLRTPGGELTADAVVIGTNGYTDQLWPGLARTLVPMISIMAATPPLPPALGDRILREGICTSDTRRLLWYYRRDHQGRLIMGGRAPFRDEVTIEDTVHLRAAVDRLYPELARTPFEFHWAGRVAMTKDFLPHLHELAPGAWAGVGYCGRGVGMGVLFGRHLADLVSGVRPADIPFPVTAMKPIFGYPFTRNVARAMIRYYRLRDRVEAA